MISDLSVCEMKNYINVHNWKSFCIGPTSTQKNLSVYGDGVGISSKILQIFCWC